jgi:hypothetical protein
MNSLVYGRLVLQQADKEYILENWIKRAHTKHKENIAMMNYDKANSLLQGRNKESRKLGNNTYLIRHPGHLTRPGDTKGECITVRLHDTDIVTYHTNGNIILDTGGWKTVTTKDRMNKYTPFCIYQDKGIWYMNASGSPYSNEGRKKSIPYFDNMVLNTDGVCLNPIPDIEKDTKALIKKINQYCKAINNLDVLPIPNAGDCWVCAFTEIEPIPHTRMGFTGYSGDAIGDTEHLLSHLDEMYIHGSLIMNALRFRGHKNPEFVFRMFQGEKEKGRRTLIVYAVRAYLKRQFHIA